MQCCFQPYLVSYVSIKWLAGLSLRDRRERSFTTSTEPFLSRHRSAETQCSRRRTDRTWYVRSAKCTRVEVIQFWT